MLSEKLLKFALLGAEWVLYLLVVLSVLSIGAMVERWLFFRRNRLDLSAVTTRLRALLEEGKRDEAAKLLREGSTIEGGVALQALAEIDRGANAVEQTLLGAMASEKPRTDRFLVFLGTLGNNAPFIGLFGTVIGIIRAFNDLGLSQEGGAAVVMVGTMEKIVTGAAAATRTLMSYVPEPAVPASRLSKVAKLIAPAKPGHHSPSRLFPTVRVPLTFH